MIVNLDTPINTLDGTQLEEKGTKLTVGNFLASVVDQAQGQNRVEMYRLAQKCTTGSADFTDGELSLLRTLVNDFALPSNIMLAQVLLALAEEQPVPDSSDVLDTPSDAQNGTLETSTV